MNRILFGGMTLAMLLTAGCDIFYKDNPAYVPWLVNKCAQELCADHPGGGTCADPNKKALFCDETNAVECGNAFKIVMFSCTPDTTMMPMTPDMGPMMPVYVEGQSATSAQTGMDKDGFPMVTVPLDQSPITYQVGTLDPDLTKGSWKWLYRADAQTTHVYAINSVSPENPGMYGIAVTQVRGAGMTDSINIISGVWVWANPVALSVETAANRFFDNTKKVDFRSSFSPTGSTLAQTPPTFPVCTGTAPGDGTCLLQ